MKEQLKKVLDKAEECFKDAEYLFEGGRYEAAVNRAYYAMFTAVQGLLLDKDIFVKTHSGAKSKFHELYLKTKFLPSELNKMFEAAFELRQDADYEFDIKIEKEEALQTIDDAKKFLKSIHSFLES